MYYQMNNGELVGADHILGPGFSLRSEDHLNYTYPYNGWWWYDTQAEAEDAFALIVNGVPQRISSFQAKAALLALNKLDAANALMANAGVDQKIKLAWETAPTFHRNSAAVNAFGAQLGLSQADLDQVFITGYTIAV